jgi:hypothetical protein
MNMQNEEKTAKERAGQPGSGMTLGNVWFTSDEHRDNFIALLDRFKAHKSTEYAAASYIAAHPEIYRRINWKKSDGPIGWYWGEWIGEHEDDPKGYHSESEIVGQLSSSYRGLVRAAVEAYTGNHHYFYIMDWLGNAGDIVYKMFVQMLEIRRDRFVFDIE